MRTAITKASAPLDMMDRPNLRQKVSDMMTLSTLSASTCELDDGVFRLARGGWPPTHRL
jgi:hypothetical protein